MLLLLSVYDPALFRVVRADLDNYPVTWKDSDVMAPHLAAYMGKNLRTGIKLNEKRRVGSGLKNDPFRADRVLSGLFCTNSHLGWS